MQISGQAETTQGASQSSATGGTWLGSLIGAVAGRRDMEFNRSEARKSRAMANSAYQRSTVDMRLAGLNPMLAYAQGGADVSSAAQKSGGEALGHTANESYRLSEELKQIRSATELNRELARKASAETASVQTSTALVATQLPKARTWENIWAQGERATGSVRNVIERSERAWQAKPKSESYFEGLKSRLRSYSGQSSAKERR